MKGIDKKKLAFLFYLGADLVDVINLTGTLRSVKIPLQNANKTIKIVVQTIDSFHVGSITFAPSIILEGGLTNHT